MKEKGFVRIDPEKIAPEIENKWTAELDRIPTGLLRPNTRSLGLIVRNDPNFGTLHYNEFSQKTEWKGKGLEDEEVFRAAELVETRYGRGATVQIDRLRGVMETVAKERPTHPVKGWLESLTPWDKTPRIDGLFPTYYGAKDSTFVRAVGKNLLIAAVARVMSPGCKCDFCIVLEGVQGAGKSTSVATLFRPEWVTTIRADIDSKDFVSGIQGFWAIELSELSSLKRSQVESIKAVLSANFDDVRLPFRRDVKRYPRQAIFIATTNETAGYLLDTTGNRRFWPIKCGERIDLEGLRRNQSQLWAEALARFRKGEDWWTVPDGEAQEAQDERLEYDSWEEVISPWLKLRNETITSEILENCLGIETGRHGRKEWIRVGTILKRLGWERVRCRTPDGLSWKYVPKLRIGTDGNNMGTPNTCALVPNVPVRSPHNSMDSLSNPFIKNEWEHGNKPIPESLFPCCSQCVPIQAELSNPGTIEMDEDL